VSSNTSLNFFFVVLKKMVKLIKIILFITVNIFTTLNLYANPSDFDFWINDFKKLAKAEGISKNTINDALETVRFLPKVLEYDRFQPEFYEDTKTYIKKRSSNDKIKNGLNLYKKEKKTIDFIEDKFDVEKELLLSLMGIETNYGKYLGKMDIISSLATLSYDKRRSEFFTSELLTLLKLIDRKVIDKNILYGSWAGAFGNFQFMPSTIKNYAIDYNKNSVIELKNVEDSFASAANYINLIGWDKNQPCFYQIELKDNVPDKYLNTSAKKINNKKPLKYFKKFIVNSDILKINKNLMSAIITPDKEIIPGAKTLHPAYLVFDNYELILKWNRSLRFALAVCTLKNKLKNEL
jgi:membrane-bound lytic murein transglycosylase B